MRTGFAAFSDTGRALTRKIAALLGGENVFYDKERYAVKEWLALEFNNCRAFIFVGAVGIAVRYVAPFIRTKDKDPAVIVLDETGRFAIPILSGHLGGGNALAAKIAALTGAEPVITTATDLYGKFAVDVWSVDNGCVIDNVGAIKHISAAVLKGEPVGFCSDFAGKSGALPAGLYRAAEGRLGICLSLDTAKQPFDLTLKVMPKILAVGAGCRKNTPVEAFEEFLLEFLARANLSLKALKGIASLDLKKDEFCFTAFAKKYNIPFVTFSPAQLSAVPGEFSVSKFVQDAVGVDNVSERAAALYGGGRVIIKKTVKNGMTLALARPDWEYICQ